MNILIYSDLHISERGSMMRGKSRLYYVEKYNEWLDSTILNNNIDFVIDCGDLVSSDVLTSKEIVSLYNFTQKNKYSDNIKTVHLLGNHERNSKDGSINSIELIKLHKNHQIISNSTVIVLGNKKLAFISYGCESDLPDADIAFTHLDLVPNGSNFIGLNHDLFKKYKKVFNDHIHNPNEFGNIVNIGSPLGSNLADDYSVARPGVIILNLETLEYKRIENPFAPLYFKLNDGDNIPDDAVGRSYVKITSTDPNIKVNGATTSVDLIPLVDEGQEIEFNGNIFDSLKEFYEGQNNVLKEIRTMEVEYNEE